MIVYFADKKLNILGLASTNLKDSFVIKDDCTVESVESGLSSLEVEIGWRTGEQLKLQKLVTVGNYMLKKDNSGNAKMYTIVTTELDTQYQTIRAYGEDAGLDFINDIASSYKAAEPQDAQFYINKYIGDSGFEIGVNELSIASKKKLEWKANSTIAERLQSIAKKFGCEVSYSYIVNGLKVTHKYINLYKKRGNHNDVKRLRLNLEIDRITIKKSIENLATALKVTGGTPKADVNPKNKKPIDLKNYGYDDGNFYVDKDSGYLVSKEGQANWSRLTKSYYHTPSANALYGQIVRAYNYDTLNKEILVSHAISELKKYDHEEVNYEIKLANLPAGVGIGDTVAVVDDTGETYITARILELTISETAQTTELVIGEFKIKSAGISERIEELANEWAEKLDSQVLYTWIAYADNEAGTGVSLDPSGKTYMGTATNQTSYEVDISDVTVFKWAKIKGDNGSPGQKGDKGDPGEISQEDLNKIEEAKEKAETAITESQQANNTADEAQKKAKKVEDEQKKSVRNKIISEAGTYHGRIGIAKKQFTFLPEWYGIFANTLGKIKFESFPHTITLSYVSDGVKKNFTSKKILWATPASMNLIGNEYNFKSDAEAAISNFKANNSTPNPSWSMNDVALFVNKSGSHYIIENYPRTLAYPGQVGKDYDIYCIAKKQENGYYKIEIASYYSNDKPGDKEKFVLSKSSTQKIIIEYDMETTKVAKATEFGETTTATTNDVTVLGSYNDETSDDDAAVFGNGTEEQPQTAVSIKKNGDMVVKGTTYAQDFDIGEEFLSFRDIADKVKKMEDAKPLLITEAFDSDFMSFTAGTIGTRGAQKKISIVKDGYNPILVTIFYIASSASCHPLVFFNEDRDAVYVNLYRATNKSYGSENPIRFIVTYMRK